ncbi:MULTISPECIES: APC family permease [unclassified Rhizobium]|uniref:APC family permease n=1 Tax=unclassified Rhizobium TaxID=2613769 RepID=UPI001C828737|nr:MULTISPECIES: APC family permease [unclassified Rhizobium]MBX5156328.1 APC family permease [Rhizobium sp. NZLR8]MBX5162457.1 APC family permease [Rhizobium sp. NZLR4b]MBX5173983.1 APC family permease [Rhizobium sp. NZLR1b]MBX5185520.1 APC family permease [Rhizobium sp. NZLR5]MBX5198589.1 APC family permease [Rhizobium sp. NZLR10]
MNTQNSQGTAENQLRKNSLGVGAVTFLVVSAAAPLTAVAGGVPLSMMLGNGPGIPLTFLLVTLILLLFAVGYVAMARHIRNAGAFYAYTAQGLGGMMGGAAALIAILAYNAMQIGVFGLFGAATSGLFAGLGLQLPWWVWTFIGIAIVAVFGYRRVDLSAKVLTVLVILEYLVVLVIDAAIFLKGGDSGLSATPFTPAAFMSGTPAIGILFCFAAFIGFEATTIYSEEAREPHKTVPRATYISVLIIGLFYMLTSWLMVAGSGADKLVPELQGLADPTTFLFGLAERYVGHWIVVVMNILFVTSLFAGVLAFHNGVARYMYVAGREGLLPKSVGVTHPVFQSPHVGSVIQTVIAAVVVALFAFTGQDPVLALFSWLTNVGTLAIILLMAFTAFAIVAFFGRNPGLENNMLVTKVLPVVTGVILMALVVYITIYFGSIAGASGVLAVFLPGLVLIAAIIGFMAAARLRSADSVSFGRLGAGQEA